MEETPKILFDFIETMKEAAERIHIEALDKNLGGKIVFSNETLKNCFPIDTPINYDLLCQLLKSYDEIESATYDGNILKIKTDFNHANYPETFMDEGCIDDIEILCAKHTLWIYDDPAGEQADFSNYTIHNIDFSGKNLCGATLKDASFRNCTFDDASLCNCDFTNSIFENCTFSNAVAEESNFTLTKLDSCNFNKAILTHSFFDKTVFNECDFENADACNSFARNFVVADSPHFRECFHDCTCHLDVYNGTTSMEMS